MDEPKWITVIADSHSRSFAYHRAFLPLFIGRGITNLFLTPCLAEKTRRKLAVNLEQYHCPGHALFALGEPEVRFHLENRFGTRNATGTNDRAVLAASAARYLEAIEAVRGRIPGQVILFQAVPKAEEEYNNLARYYNDVLATECQRRGYVFLDLWNDLVKDNRVIPHYQSDFIHLGWQIMPLVVRRLKALGLLPAATEEDSDFAWSYAYKFDLGSGLETRIWGDCDRHLLKLAEDEVRAGASLHAHTRLHVDILQELAPYLVRLEGNEERSSVVFLDCREGLLPLLYAKRAPARQAVRGVDVAGDRIAFARQLSNLAQAPKVEFRCQPDGALFTQGEPCTAIVCLERSALRERLKEELFRGVRRLCRWFFFHSRAPLADAQTMKKAGFADVRVLPLLGPHQGLDSVRETFVLLAAAESPRRQLAWRLRWDYARFAGRYLYRSIGGMTSFYRLCRQLRESI